MSVKRFLVFLSILFSAIYCFNEGVIFFGDFKLSSRLNNEINRGNLLKNVVKTIIAERKAYEEYLEVKTPDKEEALRRANTAKNFAIKYFLNSLSNTPDDIRMKDALEIVLKNAKADWESFNLSFYNFFEMAISVIISGHLEFKDVAIDADIERYMIVINRLYEALANINTAKQHIIAILQGKETLNSSSLREAINSLKHNNLNINLLPYSETKSEIIKQLERLNELEISKGFDQIRIDLRTKSNISEDEIRRINSFENDRFDLFSEISSMLVSELKAKNDEFRVYTLCLSFAMFVFSFWLFYASYKAYGWFKNLEYLNQKIKLIRDEILKKTDKNPKNLIETFIESYKTLLQNYEQEKKFTAIKDRLLVRLNKKFYLSKEQILSSIATLKKDENVLKNELVFESLERNSQIIALNYGNIKGLLDTRLSDLTLNQKPFNPQILFSNILEAQIPFTQSKKLNFLTYLDARISDELEGDAEKISVIFNSIMLAIVAKCDKFANLIVEIRNTSDSLSGLIGIETKIRTNQIFLKDEQLNALRLEDENELNDEESEFYLKVASFYLKLFKSSLEISTLGGAGNEFKFILNLKKIQSQQNFNLNRDLKIAYLPDINVKYNEFFTKTLEDLGLKFQNIISSNQSLSREYDIIFARQSTSKNINAKNLVLLKDPLTPLSVARLVYMEKNKSDNPADEKVRFLLCDKNPLSLEMSAQAFSYFDCEVIGVSSLKELKQALQLNRFNAIFIDTQFFENNPTNFAKDIRAMQSEKQNLIAIVSNTSNISERDIFPAFDAWIKKPFSQAELNQILPNYVRNYKPIKENKNFIKNENIAVYKSTKLENKIFAGALGEFQNTLEVANSFSELLIKVKTKPCSLVLVDEAAESFDMDELTSTISELRSMLKLDVRVLLFSQDLELKDKKEYIKILSPNVSKIELIGFVKSEFSEINSAQNELKSNFKFIKFKA